MIGERESADVLILSSAIGSGHMRASAALTRGFELEDPDISCSTIDFPHEVSPRVEQLLRSAYLECLKLWPTAYGRIYRSAGTGGTNSYKHYVDTPGVRTLERLSEETGARALVAPHFYGAGVLGVYKTLHPDAFTAVIMTDYVPHPIEIPMGLDLYVVADEAAAEEVAGFGVPESLIHPTGIPIDPLFEEPVDPAAVRAELLNLAPETEDDLPVVLVMGGGLGGGDLEASVGALFEVSAAMHLVVLCGSNEASRKRLALAAELGGHSGNFLAFTDRVREIMAASDVLLTKPGGLSCTEALAAGLPQVLYHPIPGNEEDNAQAMIRYGAAVMVDDTRRALEETLRLLTSPKHHDQVAKAARDAHRPHSARAASRLLLDGIA